MNINGSLQTLLGNKVLFAWKKVECLGSAQCLSVVEQCSILLPLISFCKFFSHQELILLSSSLSWVQCALCSINCRNSILAAIEPQDSKVPTSAPVDTDHNHVLSNIEVFAIPTTNISYTCSSWQSFKKVLHFRPHCESVQHQSSFSPSNYPENF